MDWGVSYFGVCGVGMRINKFVVYGFWKRSGRLKRDINYVLNNWILNVDFKCLYCNILKDSYLGLKNLKMNIIVF